MSTGNGVSVLRNSPAAAEPQALPIRGEIEPVALEASAYSDSGFAIVDADRRRALDAAVVLVIR